MRYGDERRMETGNGHSFAQLSDGNSDGGGGGGGDNEGDNNDDQRRGSQRWLKRNRGVTMDLYKKAANTTNRDEFTKE